MEGWGGKKSDCKGGSLRMKGNRSAFFEKIVKNLKMRKNAVARLKKLRMVLKGSAF